MEHLSLELSKALKELGVVVETMQAYDEVGTLSFRGKGKHTGLRDGFFPAPTFTELMAIMPDRIEWRGFVYQLHVSKLMNGYRAFYQSIGNQTDDMTWETSTESPVEALGQLVIWLAENGHLEGK